MENLKSNVTHIYDSTNNLIQLHTRIVRLEIYERLTNLISSGISNGVILLFAFFAFTFLNLGVAYYLGVYYHSTGLGFLIVGAFHSSILIIFLIFRKKIAHNKVKNAVLIKLSKDISDFDELLKIQDRVYKEIELNKEIFESNLKNIQKEFVGTEDEKLNENSVNMGSFKLPRRTITGIVDFLIKKVILRKSNIIAKTLVPFAVNTLLTSKLFHEKTSTSALENLKLKL